jgi:NCS1 family nucleobase:cation symporter-1
VSAIAVHSTAGGLRDVLGGGAIGGLGLVAIWIGTIAVNAMDDYSGSLALQATGVKVKRPVIAIAVTVLAFALTLWLNTGDLASKFTNLILFITYWIPPFAAVQIVDWYRQRGHPDVSGVLDNSRLGSGWEALAALCVGFGVSVPFMDTTLFVGPISKHVLWGGDIALVVGFVVGAAVYAGLRRWSTRSTRDAPEPARAVEVPA